MSTPKWKAEFRVTDNSLDNDQQWDTNALRFDTATEAEEHAKDLFSRGMQSTEWRVVEDVEEVAK